MRHFVSNLENYLNRDLALLRKGDAISVKLHPNLIARGWTGGTFVRWVDDGTGDHAVDLANGLAAGYIPFGSDETGDRYTSIAGQNQRYGYATMCFGGAFFYTKIYERETYQSRNGGPTAYLTYQANQPMYVSENGILTCEDESDPAVNPGGLFPDGNPIYVRFNPIGVCVVTPSTNTNNYIGIQTMM